MRHLKYLFTVPEGEKVTEKHLRRVLVSSVCSILLCMSCLVSTTWAWFTTTIVSENNVIEIGSFAASVTVENGETALGPSDSYTYILSEGEYTVTIVNDGTTKGYCDVKLTGLESFTTGTLYAAAEAEANKAANSVTFKVKVNTTLAELEIIPCWGANPGDPVLVQDEYLVGEGTEINEADADGEAEDNTDPTEDVTEPATDPTESLEPDGEATQPESTEAEDVVEPTTAPTEVPDSTDPTAAETQPVDEAVNPTETTASETAETTA